MPVATATGALSCWRPHRWQRIPDSRECSTAASCSIATSSWWTRSTGWFSAANRPRGVISGPCSIFLDDIRVATTVEKEANQRAVGTRVSAEVAKTVLGGGEPWYGRAYVVDDWRIAAYEPIRNLAGGVIGMLYVGMQERPFLAVRTDMMLTFLVVAAVGVLVVLGLTYLITRSMIHPLEEIVAASNRIADGDLNLSLIQVPSRDEIGHLADRFNKMVASIQTMKTRVGRVGAHPRREGQETDRGTGHRPEPDGPVGKAGFHRAGWPPVSPTRSTILWEGS